MKQIFISKPSGSGELIKIGMTDDDINHGVVVVIIMMLRQVAYSKITTHMILATELSNKIKNSRVLET